MGYDYDCKSGVVKSETLVECVSNEIVPSGINGPMVAKIPVVIAEPIVQVDIEAVIKLEESAFEIKRIKKNLFITQCRLIDLGSFNRGKLFLGGYVRKNIEYATADCICGEHKSISGNIRHTTVNVPFTCVTEIAYSRRPQLNAQDSTKELAMFSDSKKCNDACASHVIGSSSCEQSFQHHELFNERVYCELEEVRIFEDDLHNRPEPIGCAFPHEYNFDSITEKMVILVRLKLLQNQQVNIPGLMNGCKHRQLYN